MSTHLQPVQQLVPGGDLSAVQAVAGPVLSVERERELAEELHYRATLRRPASWLCRTFDLCSHC